MLKHPSPRDWNRARIDSLFEDGDGSLAPRAERPFRDYLHRTPAAPMSGATRVLLWAASLIVVSLLAFTIWRTLSRPPARPRVGPRPSVSRKVPNLSAEETRPLA